MKAAVITFPGSNCDDDAVYTLSKLCGFQVDTLWHKDTPSLDAYDLVVLPGGFSYGDYLRCGAIASLSPVGEEVKKFAAKGGFVIGICNGFQILCEAGLLPGALARNEKLKFVCKDIFLKTETTDAPWTSGMKAGQVLRIPIAHGDGRYVASPEEALELQKNHQILFRYCTESGTLSADANPNGSTDGIAGVCNRTKNVFGLMPHPERASDLRSRDGMHLWESLLSTLKQRKGMAS